MVVAAPQERRPPKFPLRQFRFETAAYQRLPPVLGHRGQLREVLVNIVQNAIDELGRVHDRARTLRVRTTSAQRNRVAITIEDSGGGIAAERLPNLFTAFVSTKARGMGLGLSLCQMIVDRHNGQLAVSSELGKGTRFEVSFPAEPAAAAAVRAAEGRASADPIKAET